MASTQQKVSLYSVNDLKNATDDAIAPYLTSLPEPYTFKQQHSATNVRLALGYAAVCIAGALFIADYKLGWDATKIYTLPACLAYFLLNGLFTYWLLAVEAGTIFVGIRPGGQKLTLKSSTQKFEPIYKLKYRYEAASGRKWEDTEIDGAFMEWFNMHGYLQKKELHQWLAKNIEMIRLADPGLQKASAGNQDEEDDDVITVASPTGRDTTTDGVRKIREKRKT